MLYCSLFTRLVQTYVIVHVGRLDDYDKKAYKRMLDAGVVMWCL